MPFCKEFLENASKTVDIKVLEAEFEHVKTFIIKALENASRVNPNIRVKDTDIYYHGSYANQTNIFFPSNLEIIVELKKTAEYDPSKITEQNYYLHNNYYVDMPFSFTPQMFRELFTEEFVKLTGSDRFEDRDKSLLFRGLGNVKRNIDIVPCFSFNYHGENEILKGILLYDQDIDSNVISFPRIHAQNGKTKDTSCMGNYKKLVRLFKTLNTIAVREFNQASGLATGYFVECLLFNAPNNLYLGANIRDVFEKVLNYLFNCKMQYFCCQNMVWQLFGSAKEFWREDSAKEFLNSIHRLYYLLPNTRKQLA